LGYTELGQELGHTGDTPMVEAILDGTFEHDSLSDDALAAIVKQLLKHPEDKLFSLLLQKRTLNQHSNVSQRRRHRHSPVGGVHHYKACVEGSDDGLADIQSSIRAAMMTVTLATGFCPEQSKK
jgi:hypothetical protein